MALDHDTLDTEPTHIDIEPVDTTITISVVVCSHDIERLDTLVNALDAVLDQSSEPHEILFVADGATQLADAVTAQYPDAVDVIGLEENQGLSTARNVGAEAATGDVVAFLDDDAIPSPYWIAELQRIYEQQDAVAVGGYLYPKLDGRPLYLPREFDWLVGGTHDGFTDGDRSVQEVRNTFGSNISFRRDIFLVLGGFDENQGRKGSQQLQAEETLFCARLNKETGERVWYSPNAVVEHDIGDSRLAFRSLLKRAFWQGYSKSMMAEKLPGDNADEEQAYLEMLLTDALPRRVVEAATIPIYTGVVGAGYVWHRLHQAFE